jgi:hypothetical protein|tara:strand:+ start:1286 stop:1609 length:324 start_codon:yes stop_codon:yes gene_type:complete
MDLTIEYNKKYKKHALQLEELLEDVDTWDPFRSTISPEGQLNVELILSDNDIFEVQHVESEILYDNTDVVYADVIEALLLDGTDMESILKDDGTPAPPQPSDEKSEE